VAFLLPPTAVILFLVSVLIGVWKGDGDTGFKVGVTITTLAIAFFFTFGCWFMVDAVDGSDSVTSVRIHITIIGRLAGL